MNIEQIALENEFSNFNFAQKENFLLLTKKIIKFQENTDIKLLNLQPCIVNIFENYPICDFNENYLYKLAEIYQTLELFKEIKTIILKTDYIIKLNPIFEQYINNLNEETQLINLFNAIILVNFIKKQMVLITIPQEQFYLNKHHHKLLNKLNDIRTSSSLNSSNISTLLNLDQLGNLYTEKEIYDFFNEVYNFNNVDVIQLSNQLDNDEYHKIYNLIKDFTYSIL
jgi:hypothetical protein